jgi:23S rRNA pseudouridine1911/1915/1917 synthase
MDIDQNTFLITEKQEITRIDKLLAEKFNAKSRTYFQYLLENGSVLVNGSKVKKRFIPKMGDEIEIFFQAVQDITLKPENIPLDILYEDEHILAINKPAGMVVHPACGNWSNTFVNALLYHCKDLISLEDKIRPGIVHRLDKDTTGVLLAAKTQIAHQNLIDQFKLRKIKKQYLAIVINKPTNQIINLPIARHPFNRKEMAIDEKGKEAITEIKLLAYNEKLSLILVIPHTGRTHQIRVHLKHINSAVLGDITYGNKNFNYNYKIYNQMLHAYILEFFHPITNEPMKITAPLTEEFKKFISILS